MLKHLVSAKFEVRTGITEANQEFWHKSQVTEVIEGLVEAGIPFSVEPPEGKADTLVTLIRVDREWGGE